MTKVGETSAGRYCMIKHLSDIELEKLLELFVRAWSEWKEVIIITIRKPSKDASDPGSY